MSWNFLIVLSGKLPAARGSRMMNADHSRNSPTPTSLNSPRKPVTGVKNKPVILLLNLKSLRSLKSVTESGTHRLFRSAYHEMAHGMSEQITSFSEYHSLSCAM